MKNTAQNTINEAAAASRFFRSQLTALKVDGRYGRSVDLLPEAAMVIADAVEYFTQLGEEIGHDTQLGSNGTPATNAAAYARKAQFLTA